ncbi:unnamed protein product, partial [Prunus brigantina]
MKERRRRQAEEEREEEKDDEQVVMAMGMLDLSSQGSHRGSQVSRGLNVDRRRQSWGKNLLEDYFIQNSLYSIKCDATGVLGFLLEQKLTASLWMLAFGTSANQVDEIARMGKSIILESLVRFCDAIETFYMSNYLSKPTFRDLQWLLQKAETRGFPGMIGSIDCMHWQWKNCPTAWQGDYGNKKGQKSMILEVVASFDTWIWHAFFGVAGSQNDLNMLSQSSVFDDVLRGQAPQITYKINNTVYSGGYYLMLGS